MNFSSNVRSFFPRMLPLAFGLLSLTACEDSGEKKTIQAKLDLERNKAEQLESQTQVAISEVKRLTQGSSELSQAVKDLQSANADLNKTIDSNTREISSMNAELDATKKSLSEKNAKVNELNEAISSKNEAVQRLENELSGKSAKIAEIEAEIASNKQTIAELRKVMEAGNDARVQELASQVAAKSEENKQLITQLGSLKEEQEQTSSKLTKSEGELAKLKAEHAVLAEELEQKSYAGVMALLENPGPESLFGVTDWIFKDTYETQQDCLMIFNIDRDLEAVANNRNVAVPRINGFSLVPLRTAYQKVMVCQENGVVQAHKESGFIYKGIPNENTSNRVLLTTRSESSCDPLAETVKTNNVFTSPIQLFYPYVGEIDGIETINVLRPSNQVLEYNMGSGHPGILASSCKELVDNGTEDSLARTACRIAQGEPGLNVTVGCFAEESTAGKTKLIFNK